MYLHHILTRKEDALITRVFWAQVNQPVKGDWCLVVREDIETIGMGHMSYKDIKSMTKEALCAVVNIKVREAAFRSLLMEKEKCSKLKLLTYPCLRLQPYLSPGSNLTNTLKRALFRWRCHAIQVKQNIGIKDAKCPLCREEGDTPTYM